MNNRFLYAAAVFVASASTLSAQQIARRADIRGGGDPNRGTCTIEVVVDSAAEVEIRGDTAYLRTINGQPAQWRRFECNAPLPPNPEDFRFAGVDGRGRQDLVREPGQGGGPVIRIEDSQGGAEGYTFDIFWRVGYNDGGPQRLPDARPGYQTQSRPAYRERRYNTQQAVQLCQDAARQQAFRRFRVRTLDFRGTRIDDNPGRADWVIGTFNNSRRGQAYRFSCSVDFDNGTVRSVNVDRMSRDEFDRFGIASDGRPGVDSNAGNNQALQGCQRAVTDRLRQDGYGRADFRSINVNDRPGPNDQIVGVVRADGPNGETVLDFSCAVELRDGDVRSVDVRQRR